jgi:hypothetical protein
MHIKGLALSPGASASQFGAPQWSPAPERCDSAPLQASRAAAPSDDDGILPELPGQPERSSGRNTQYQHADFCTPVRVVRHALTRQRVQPPRFGDAYKAAGSRSIAPTRQAARPGIASADESPGSDSAASKEMLEDPVALTNPQHSPSVRGVDDIAGRHIRRDQLGVTGEGWTESPRHPVHP